MSRSTKSQSTTPRRPETGRKGGLIEIRNSEPPQVDGHMRQRSDDARRRRYRLRAEAQRREVVAARRRAGLSPDDHETPIKTGRITYCGRPMRGVGGVSVKAHEGHAHYSGVAHCGSIWTCAVCSPIIRRRRGEDVAEAAKRHLEAGGGLFMVTFTLRHGREDSLKRSLGILSSAYSRMARSRSYRSWRDGNADVGSIKALEVMVGVNGWHPHNHVLFFSSSPVPEDGATALKMELFPMWASAVEAEGGSCSWDAFDVRVVGSGEEMVASYVTKTEKGAGIGRELTLSDVKSGRAKTSLNPFELLEDDSPEARAAWDEYAQTMKGRASLRWSRGLRDHFGLSAEKSDEEIVDELEQVGEIEMTVDADVYVERVARNPQVAAGVLEAVERHDFEAAARLVGVPLSWSVMPGGVLVARLTARPLRE